MTRTLFFTIVVTLVFQMSLFAQSGHPIQNSFGFGPRAGYYKSGDAEEGSWLFGGQARLRIGQVLGVEAAAEYRSKEKYNFGTYNGQDYTITVSYVPVTVSALLFLPLNSQMVPYGIAGVGWYYTIVDYSAAFETNTGGIFKDANSSEFGYHIGLGIDYALSEHMAVHGDYRWLFVDSTIKGTKDITTNTSVDTRNSNGSEISLGLTFYF